VILYPDGIDIIKRDFLVQEISYLDAVMALMRIGFESAEAEETVEGWEKIWAKGM